MRTSVTTSFDLFSGDLRMDANYHASSGQYASRVLKNSKLPTVRLNQVCQPGGIFIPGRFRRVYVDNPDNGLKWLSPTDMQKADLSGLGFISRKYTSNLDTLRLHKGWILLSRSGTIGNLAYVRADMDGLIGSDDIIRIVADSKQILPGYLYAILCSPIIVSLIQQKTYGAVIPHIEAHHILDLPIPRLDPSQEEKIHQMIETASSIRVEPHIRLRQAQDRFYKQVLNLDPIELSWNCLNEHAFAVGTAQFDNQSHRLDGFHHVGYVGEAEQYLNKTIPLEKLVEAYQPSMFKRPYTDSNGIPFLSGIDLYNYYPKPHMYISRKMERLESYITESGTILVQNIGQRYGLFGRPTILPKHLDKVAVTQHLMRVFPKDPSDRGFVYIWLSTELGRRLLLKNSFGTSMGVLFERSFREMLCPDCSSDLRHSFEKDLVSIVSMQEQANELEDQAQSILANALAVGR